MNPGMAEGTYWYCVDHHNGQWSREYRILSKLGKIYRPGPMMKASCLLVNEGGEHEDSREVYAALCVDQSEPFWDVELTDDGTMDTVFECYCRTCEHTWQERFDSEDRSEDEYIDREVINDMKEMVYEEMYKGSGACQCGVPSSSEVVSQLRKEGDNG